MSRPVFGAPNSPPEIGDELSPVQRLERHIETLKTAVVPWITRQRASRTWQLYQDLTPASRRTLPHAVQRAVLRQIVPGHVKLVPRPTLFAAQEQYRAQWAARIHFVVDEICNSEHGLSAGDAKIALNKFASLGDVQGAERVYAQFMRQKKAITPTQRNVLAVARLESLLAWYEGVLLLRSQTPCKKEWYYSSAARTDPEFNAKVDQGIPERDRVAQPKADLVLGLIWSVLDDFIHSRSTPTATSINMVVMTLDQTRQIYHQKAFASALDEMMERVFTIAYGIDLKFLRMKDAVANRVNTLKGLHKEAAQVLLNWLFRRNEVWRGVALLELLDSGHWNGVVEDELVKVETKRRESSGKGMNRDDDFGPTLAEATASFAETNQDIDMFGRIKPVASESTVVAAPSSKLPSSLSLISFPSRRKIQPRTYADFYPSEVPLPSKIPYAKVAEEGNAGPNEFSKRPFTTTYRNIDGQTYRTAIAHARDVGDLDALIHFTRMFTTRAVQQQVYWLQRVFTEQRRLALSKKWREEQLMVKYQQDRQAKQDALAARRAAYIAQARAEGSQLSDAHLERAAQKVHRDRRLAPRPASETVWPQDLLPPRIVFSYTSLRLVKRMVRALPCAHAELQEVNRIIAQAAQRVYEEHVVLSGRKPPGTKLTDYQYARHMRQEGVQVLNASAPMAAYFDVGPEERSAAETLRDRFSPLAYLARLNRTHAALVDLLDASLLQRHTAAEHRTRVNRRWERKRRAERKQEEAADEEALLGARLEAKRANQEARWMARQARKQAAAGAATPSEA